MLGDYYFKRPAFVLCTMLLCIIFVRKSSKQACASPKIISKDLHPCRRRRPCVKWVTTKPGRACWYRRVQKSSFGRRCGTLLYLPSARPFSFPHPQLRTVHQEFRMIWAGKVRCAQWPAFLYFRSLRKLFATMLGILHPGPAVPVVHE